ncbi:hypothetical protein ACFFWC_01370 [Plantactinospora siamensis]|uniref:Ribosomal protein L7/L12 C-terminal domain-containing protein n=1 Tax=Plantactinospora siamensis TaxID=555372 RepID=A0ABV6NT93_9ACTN
MDFAFLAVSLAILGVLLMQVAGSGRRDGTAWRLGEIERRLDLVMNHLGIEDPGAELPGVREHLARGDKIQAIKAYREATGADLRTAKDAVEAMGR